MKKERISKALENLSWTELRKELDARRFDANRLDELTTQILNCDNIFLKRPDAIRQQKRDQLIGSIEKHVGAELDEASAQKFSELATAIWALETGYREILGTLDQSSAGALTSVERIAGVFEHAKMEYSYVASLMERERNNNQITTDWAAVDDGKGNRINGDGALTAISDMASMSLKMEAYKCGWIAEDGEIILPELPSLNGDQVGESLPVSLCALYWRKLEQSEQRFRFLGGTLHLYEVEEIQDKALKELIRPSTKKVLLYNPNSEFELYDYISNERLHDRLMQTYFEAFHLYAPVADYPTPAEVKHLPPTQYLSKQEQHSIRSLSEILSFNVLEDTTRYADLTLVEWVRGYCVLQHLATEKIEAVEKQPMSVITEDEIITLLVNGGFSKPSAKRFVKLATFHKSSADLFDQPLIRRDDGNLILFGPSILQINPVRVVLSAIANLKVPFVQKGQAFEETVLAFLRQQDDIEAHKFSFTANGEEFEYDCVAAWEKYIFLFECKNKRLSGHSPRITKLIRDEHQLHIRQVSRLANALIEHPDKLQEKSGISVSEKTIIPVILNCLPFWLPTSDNNVRSIDFSMLHRFFENGSISLATSSKVTKAFQLVHKMHLKKIWEDDKPTVEDFLRYIDSHHQVTLMEDHIVLQPEQYQLTSDLVLLTYDYCRLPMTANSVSSAMNSNPRWTEAAMERNHRLVSKLRRSIERKMVRRQKRDWRKRNWGK